MPRKKSKEEAARYMREWRKRKKEQQTELDAQIKHVKQMQEIAALDEVKERHKFFQHKREAAKPKARPLWLRREVNRRKQLPPDGMCSCGRGPLKSRQFVVDNGVAVCLICYRSKQ